MRYKGKVEFTSAGSRQLLREKCAVKTVEKFDAHSKKLVLLRNGDDYGIISFIYFTCV